MKTCLETNSDVRQLSTGNSTANNGRNTVNNTLEKKLSCSDVSPKEQMLSHANLKVMSVEPPHEKLHVLIK